MCKTKIRGCLFALALVCGICTGCGSKENLDSQQNSEAASSASAESSPITEEETEAAVSGKTMTIPKTQKEHDELFGTVDENGEFVPPEDSYVNPKTGNIINREGVVIGSAFTKPCPYAVG